MLEGVGEVESGKSGQVDEVTLRARPENETMNQYQTIVPFVVGLGTTQRKVAQHPYKLQPLRAQSDFKNDSH